MLDNYTQTLQDQIGQLGKLLGVQSGNSVNPVLPETPAQPANRFDCVDGIEGARSVLKRMLPSSKHIVWDTNKDVFYVLQTDANNNPARIQICPFTVEMEPTMEDLYVTKDDFNALAAKIDLLINSRNSKEVKRDA